MTITVNSNVKILEGVNKVYNLFIYLFLIIKGKTAIVNHIYGETLFLYN